MNNFDIMYLRLVNSWLGYSSTFESQVPPLQSFFKLADIYQTDSGAEMSKVEFKSQNIATWHYMVDKKIGLFQ